MPSPGTRIPLQRLSDNWQLFCILSERSPPLRPRVAGPLYCEGANRASRISMTGCNVCHHEVAAATEGSALCLYTEKQIPRGLKPSRNDNSQITIHRDSRFFYPLPTIRYPLSSTPPARRRARAPCALAKRPNSSSSDREHSLLPSARPIASCFLSSVSASIRRPESRRISA